jgi:hypothetical protein
MNRRRFKYEICDVQQNASPSSDESIDAPCLYRALQNARYATEPYQEWYWGGEGEAIARFVIYNKIF